MTGAREEHFRMFALYNRWANARLYQAAMRLPPELLAREAGAFFGSLMGTLNHILAADRIWMARLEGNSPRGAKLDEILHARIEALAAARRHEDERLIDYVFAITEERYGSVLRYATASGLENTQPLHHVLAHVFNHQTHHRGQAHDLICRLAGPAQAPALDLIAYQRLAALEEGN